jgi:hypothetical protein
MAYSVVPKPGEEMALEVELKISEKARAFHFAISNKAIYIPRIKLIARTDPFYFQRVPLDQIQRITISRLRPYVLWVLAGLMITVGLFSTIWMMQPVLRREPGAHQISGWPISVFVCGFLVPFAARSRFALEIEFRGGRYRWKPPLVVDKASKESIAQTLARIVEACEHVGIHVTDKRQR